MKVGNPVLGTLAGVNDFKALAHSLALLPTYRAAKQARAAVMKTLCVHWRTKAVKARSLLSYPGGMTEVGARILLLF